MCFMAKFIVHCEDDGTFLAIRNGHHTFTNSFADALRFSRVDLAIDNALGIDETMQRVRILTVYEL